MRQKDFERLVQLLAEKAITAAPDVGVKGYFRSLVIGAELPRAFKEQRGSTSTGDARVDAIELVRWALDKGTNPLNGFSTLGTILVSQFADSGLEQAAVLAALFVAYELAPAAELDVIAQRYQAPRLAAGGGDHGPSICWRGAGDVELQGWLRPEPDLLDVGFLKRAIERAASVCRVEVGLSGEQGSGVLIDADIVLTNFHVLGADEAAVRTAAPSTKLRFGAFTMKGGDEAAGQVVSLSPDAPLIACSSDAALDFALLRAGPAIRALTDIVPAPFSLKNPVARAAVNILQHPGGKAMMLALSANGVTGAYSDTGRLQYVSRTAPGSSGGPCLDDDWNVVAVHHAVRSKGFGVIGEGILFSNIHREIAGFLRARPV
jgi:endonuclease G, mitochondrial